MTTLFLLPTRFSSCNFIIDVFRRVRKIANIDLVPSCPSVRVRPTGTTRLPLDEF